MELISPRLAIDRAESRKHEAKSGHHGAAGDEGEVLKAGLGRRSCCGMPMSVGLHETCGYQKKKPGVTRTCRVEAQGYTVQQVPCAAEALYPIPVGHVQADYLPSTPWACHMLRRPLILERKSASVSKDAGLP